MPRVYTRSTPEELKIRRAKRHKDKYQNDPAYKQHLKEQHYFYIYGETLADRDQRLLAQDSKCGMCRSPTPGTKNGWHTDHDHITGKIRSLLCHKCNFLLGLVEGGHIDHKTLDVAYSYVEKYRAK